MSSLLATKLRCPPIPSERVQRPHLIQRLNEGLELGRQITLVSAPAGFGKSTCISEWVKMLDMSFTWLSLDPADDEPERFFTYFIAALQKVDKDLKDEIESILLSGQLPSVEVFSTTLINHILEIESRFLLILDDFHLIQDRFILQVFEKLVTNQPSPLHLVLVTREDPSLPLARLRANNQITEIRAGDLRFNNREAGRFLNEVMDLGLSQMDIAMLEDRTEGWIAGLQLAVLSIKDRENPSHFIATLSGNQRYILGYLTEEVLNRQPEEIQNFLLQTSILDRLCGDLCNAMTGRSDSYFLLERLFNANLFLIPLDDEQQWYRYHHLFADLLRDRQTILHKDQSAELHRRAANWYAKAAQEALLPDGIRSRGETRFPLSEKSSFANAAIQHALAAADYELAVHLLESHAIELIAQGYVKIGQGWLNAIPAEFSSQSPKANLAFAWMHLLRGTIAQASPYLDRLQAIFSPTLKAPAYSKFGDETSLRAEWLALQAYLRTLRGKPAESLDLANQALEIAPVEDDYVRSLAYNALGSAHLMMNDYVHTVEIYQKAIFHGRTASNFVLEKMGISVLAQIAIQHGQLHFVHEIASQGLDRLERSGSPPSFITGIRGALGQVYYQWNQIETARSHFLHAIKICSMGGYTDGEVVLRALLSRLLQLEGDLEASTREIQAAVELMRSGVSAWVTPEVLSQQVRVCLAQDRLAAAVIALNQEGFASQGELSFPDFDPGQKVTYQSGLIYNSALRVLLYRARVKGEMGRLKPGVELADRLIGEALQGQYLTIALEALLLRAQMVAVLENGEAKRAAGMTDVAKALELAEPEGFISIFLEEGLPIAEAVADCFNQNRLGSVQPDYVRKILSASSGLMQLGAAPSEPAGTKPDVPDEFTPVEPLSKREIEVLNLICDGCSNQEISERLVLSLHTVKKHVSNIFTKLGVNSRTHAVARARFLKLL